MRAKKHIIFVLFIFTCMITGCIFAILKSPKAVSASTIFTPQIQEKTSKIIFYPNGQGIIINKKEDIARIYSILNSLSLTPTLKKETHIDGSYRFEIVTDTSTIVFSLNGYTLSTNDTIYTYDKEIDYIMKDIENIAETYK